MSDRHEPTAEEKIADAPSTTTKYVAAHQNSPRDPRATPNPVISDNPLVAQSPEA
jgi:hypothetical protein